MAVIVKYGDVITRLSHYKYLCSLGKLSLNFPELQIQVTRISRKFDSTIIFTRIFPSGIYTET